MKLLHRNIIHWDLDEDLYIRYDTYVLRQACTGIPSIYAYLLYVILLTTVGIITSLYLYQNHKVYLLYKIFLAQKANKSSIPLYCFMYAYIVYTEWTNKHEPLEIEGNGLGILDFVFFFKLLGRGPWKVRW